MERVDPGAGGRETPLSETLGIGVRVGLPQEPRSGSVPRVEGASASASKASDPRAGLWRTLGPDVRSERDCGGA